MARGVLRVYLGSAPGVGKTYRMLDEGWRRKERGTDVVVGYVEPHDRPLTTAQLRDLEVVPRVVREYRGALLEEMDLDAVLARRPAVALVDELAHTNMPGGRHEKRWQDVEELLDAGIDVITTVNIQHLESVNDVVEKITGIAQKETVPDAVVRRAEQIELVDITPEALRRRMAHGNIYRADQIDASLSNYFRTGNLSALRELSLLWVADRVEDALRQYQEDHDINQTWETRERLIVGVTGTEVDEALLRRAARIASRTGAELFAVHVVNTDALRATAVETTLARDLVREFEGRFEEVVDDDIATALVSFARTERGTQIVVGASRPHAAWRPPSGVVEKVLRLARDLDVHVIAVGGERPSRAPARRQKRRVSWRRQSLGLGVTAVVMPLLTVVLSAARSSVSLSTDFLVYLLAVLALTTWTGALVGVVSAVAAFGLENYYFVQPLHTLVVARPDDVVALVAFLVFAVAVSVAVSRFRQRTSEAERARGEARILAQAAASVATSHEDLGPLLDSLRAVFNARGVAVLAQRGEGWTVDVASGELTEGLAAGATFPIDDEHTLAVEGVALDEQDRTLVGAFAGRIAAGLASQVMARDSAEFAALAEAAALRRALFRTAATDLRGPLEEVAALIASVRRAGTVPADGAHQLEEVDARVVRLTRLVTNLVDAGRLEAGEVTPVPATVIVADLLAEALASADARGRTVRVEAPDEPIAIVTDRYLAARAIANVVTNGCRFGPPDEPVRVSAGVVGESVQVLVVDRGPGMPEIQRAIVTAPFQHLSGAQLNAGINLTVAAGFVQLLGGQLHFEDTPTGGLTVAIELPRETPSGAP
ncbi:MAG: sensor histidine kinase KdpD [Acidobacteriota bacterium]|nr:sensor histidine kinase KdpD [Acidobacteriota bacterium]